MGRAVEEYIGKPVTSLPTPALVINRTVLHSNIDRLHQDVAELGIDFRPHVKTLKSAEVTNMMLRNGAYRKIVASTICEIEGCLPLADKGILDECLYGLPVYPSVMPRLYDLAKKIRIVLMIDNIAHIKLLEDFQTANSELNYQWPVFVKINVGSNRAGVSTSHPRVQNLIYSAEASPMVRLAGFYCHAGHSYAGQTMQHAQDALRVELDGVLAAAKLAGNSRPLILSIGSTPTAHVLTSLKASLPEHMTLELHAGNFPANDLQQVSTGLVDLHQQAITVLAEVCSIYPERNEALLNAGVLALSREESPLFSGYGMVVGKPNWRVIRLSQEHGILGQPDISSSGLHVEDEFKIGEKVMLYCQHACITSAAFEEYFVIDERERVTEVWKPWKFW